MEGVLGSGSWLKVQPPDFEGTFPPAVIIENYWKDQQKTESFNREPRETDMVWKIEFITPLNQIISAIVIEIVME